MGFRKSYQPDIIFVDEGSRFSKGDLVSIIRNGDPSLVMVVVDNFDALLRDLRGGRRSHARLIGRIRRRARPSDIVLGRDEGCRGEGEVVSWS